MRLPFLRALLRPRARGRPRHRSSGQSVVEFALLVPVMLLLMLTAIDLGRLVYGLITVTNAAKEGALVASQGGTYQAGQPCSDSNTVMCGVLTEADGGFVEVDRARVTLTPAVCDKNAMYPTTGTPPMVTVSVDAPFRVLTPIIGDIVGRDLTLTGTADAQCLVVPRVTYPSIPAPVAAFTASPTSGSAPLTVSFDASASYSESSTIVSYEWSFGDTETVPDASHTFAAPGSYSVTLTVTDNRGQTTTSAPQTITVAGSGGPTCPTVTFTAKDKSNKNFPHRMDLTGELSPSSNGWTWEWTGAISATGSSPTVDFPSSGQHTVTVTATKGACSVSDTQTVTAP